MAGGGENTVLLNPRSTLTRVRVGVMGTMQMPLSLSQSGSLYVFVFNTVLVRY